MASLNKLPSGRWRAQVRRKGQNASKTFRLKSDAEAWAIEAERAVDLGQDPSSPRIDTKSTFGHLIDLHIADMQEVGRPLLRSKAKNLEKLKADLGRIPLNSLNRERLIAFGKARSKEGAGPVTIGMDLGYIRTILVHATAVHGIETPTEQVTLARVALRRLGVVGKGDERDRRPTQDELDRIIAYHDNNPRQLIPVGRIVEFAVATGMRQDEICSLSWSDIDLEARLATVRNRKDPRRKQGNHQQVPLLDVTGYDAVTILEKQRRREPVCDRAFPYNGRSVGSAFRRACRELGIKDLRFHDLRHEATSRLFEAGFDIPEVSLVTGHKDWKMLRRYLNLRPAQLLLRKGTSNRYG
ncbi:MAG: site-specific integrase [Hyphomicrobiaceae bacterium]